jgi:hypothetical protein
MIEPVGTTIGALAFQEKDTALDLTETLLSQIATGETVGASDQAGCVLKKFAEQLGHLSKSPFRYRLVSASGIGFILLAEV